ncbi:MAG: hypothetical protein GY855_13585 [candidate division Zixibacteria bacterium]|nr:hypothetical protein [candidate division Zixibacteria bacterium]
MIEMSEKQQHYFMDYKDSKIFFAYHPPAENSRNGCGVLICDPILEEKQDAHRAIVNFSNLLSDNGFGVLRFDFRGQGESNGDFNQFSPDDLFDDILLAIKELKSKQGLSSVNVLSLRYGGNLAVKVLDNIDVNRLILWAPIYDCRSYAEMILRSNLTTQLLKHRKVIENRAALVKKLSDGKTINIDGYELNKLWYDHISNDSLSESIKTIKCKTTIMDIAFRPDKPNVKWDKFVKLIEDRPSIETIRVKGENFWNLIPLYAVRPPELFGKTLDILKNDADRQQ